MIIVSDTSPITHLFQIRQLNLLQALFHSVIIPTSVYAELLEIPEQKEWLSENSSNWVIIKSVSDQTLVGEFQKLLDRGESEAIVLAKELKADTLLMDEAGGRLVAVREGLRVTGVLGVLLEAKKQHLVPFVKPLLAQLIENKFRVSDSLYHAILKSADEL
jgi:predicted nucleic acid-binding protein